MKETQYAVGAAPSTTALRRASQSVTEFLITMESERMDVAILAVRLRIVILLVILALPLVRSTRAIVVHDIIGYIHTTTLETALK